MTWFSLTVFSFRSWPFGIKRSFGSFKSRPNFHDYPRWACDLGQSDGETDPFPPKLVLGDGYFERKYLSERLIEQVICYGFVCSRVSDPETSCNFPWSPCDLSSCHSHGRRRNTCRHGWKLSQVIPYKTWSNSIRIHTKLSIFHGVLLCCLYFETSKA